jgi:hypothetical protein
MEQQENIPKRQRSAIIALLVFSIGAFAVCFITIFGITIWHRNYLLTQRIQQTPPGYFVGNTYVNELVGWQISFPENYSTYSSEQLRSWRYLSLVPGFGEPGRQQLQLFLVAGEYFSTIALAQKDLLSARATLLEPQLLIDRSHQAIRKSITETSRYPVHFESFNDMVNGIGFRGLAIEFTNGLEPVKWQRVYSTIFDGYMLHFAIVYQDSVQGAELESAFFQSRFHSR